MDWPEAGGSDYLCRCHLRPATHLKGHTRYAQERTETDGDMGENGPTPGAALPKYGEIRGRSTLPYAGVAVAVRAVS